MTAGDRTILITGATDGVGRRVAERLARPGVTILVHGRNRDRGEQVLAAIRRAGGAASFYAADLSSLSETRTLAEAIQRDHRGLDVLVNNAAIGFGAPGEGRQTSPDGHELHFAVNYLSCLLLTRLLLPLVKAASGGRIVNVSSLGQQKIDFADVMLTHDYSGIRAYRQSKLAQIMFTFDLADELKASGVTVNCLHPATFMNTTMVRISGVAPTSTVDEGADAILQLIESGELAGKTGLFFNGMRPSRVDAQAYDATARRQLRALSYELVGRPEPKGETL